MDKVSKMQAYAEELLKNLSSNMEAMQQLAATSSGLDCSLSVPYGGQAIYLAYLQKTLEKELAILKRNRMAYVTYQNMLCTKSIKSD